MRDSAREAIIACACAVFAIVLALGAPLALFGGAVFIVAAAFRWAIR